MQQPRRRTNPRCDTNDRYAYATGIRLRCSFTRAPSSNSPSNAKVPANPSVGAGTFVATTLRRNDCVAAGATPFVAVIVSVKSPNVVGMPASVPVPSPLSVKVTPDGRPATAIAGTGAPVAVTANVFVFCSRNTALATLVMTGAVVPTRLPVLKPRNGEQLKQ